MLFWLLGVERTSAALLSHYFHPCLRLGQQFRIPEPSQTRSLLKPGADATASVSPEARIRLRSRTAALFHCGYFSDARQVRLALKPPSRVLLFFLNPVLVVGVVFCR